MLGIILPLVFVIGFVGGAYDSELQADEVCDTQCYINDDANNIGW